jgi:NAD kinase
MRYFLSAADDPIEKDYAELLEAHGYRVTETYDDDAVLLSLGGDGSILYNSRRYEEPTILPVAGPGSEANTIDVDSDTLLGRLADLEDGTRGTDYRLEAQRKLEATREGEPIRDGFTALNDVHLHHADPGRAAKFSARILDEPNGDPAADGDPAVDSDAREETVYGADRLIGDGLLVATPFGSSGYYRSIADGTFRTGVGAAFNNVHKPVDAPRSIVLSEAGRIELSLLTTTRASSAVLARDDDPDVYALEPDEPVSISLSDRVVEIVRFDR